MDADGNIVKISKAAIVDLFVGPNRYKLTVPDASFVAAGYTLPYYLWDTDSTYELFGINAHNMTGTVQYWGAPETEVCSLVYDPEGVTTLLIEASMLFSFGRPTEYEYSNYPAGDLIMWASLYMDDLPLRTFVIMGGRVFAENSSDEPDATYYIPKLMLQGTMGFTVQKQITEEAAATTHRFSLKVGYIAGNMRIYAENRTVYNRSISVIGTRG